MHVQALHPLGPHCSCTHVPPLQHLLYKVDHRNVVMAAAKKGKKHRTADPQKGKQKQEQQQAASTWVDPRLQWARPEWLQQSQHQAPTESATQQTTTASSNGGDNGIAQVAAAARASVRPWAQRPKPDLDSTVITRDDRRMLNKLTYGAYSREHEGTADPIATNSTTSSGTVSSSTDEPTVGSSSSNSRAAAPAPELFQALGIDFGRVRVGVAVRQDNYNIPLFTWEQQDTANAAVATTTSSSSSSSSSSSTTNGSSSSSNSGTTAPAPQQPRQKQQQQQQRLAEQQLEFERLSHTLLQTALQQGCDGFVIGLPMFDVNKRLLLSNSNAPPAGSAAAAAISSRTATAAAAAGPLGPHARIRAFAQCLADAAAAYQLPVLLVDEQWSSKQARAVRGGRAQYDIPTVQQLRQLQQQQKQQELLQQQQQQRGQRDSEASSQQQQRQQQRRDPGRDAYAAAVILSRYYNGMGGPVEVVRPQTAAGGATQQQQQQQQTYTLGH